MASLRVDPAVLRYAQRTETMSASEVRALFAVASRPEVISLAGGMPYVQALPIEDVLDVTQRVIKDRGATALQYGGGAGHVGLRERLCALMAEEGVNAHPDQLVITDGAQQGLDLVAKILIDRGDEIAVEAPSYVGAISAFGAYEPQFVQIPLDDQGLEVEELKAAFSEGIHPKFVYVVPNFHNPAGVTMSLARRERLVEACREAHVPILEDNPYGRLRFEGEHLPTLRSLDPSNVIYLGTLSKVFAPGVRIGWALGEPDVIERLVLAKEAANLCSSSLTQLIAEEYLAGDRWRVNLASLNEVYLSRRDTMLAALGEHFPTRCRWTQPAGGFYVWVRLPREVDAAALLPEAVEHKVAYVPGTAFYPDGRGRDRMRLAFCYPPEDAIREGIRRLGDLLSERIESASA
jgi:2-aminoadipate transaminase